MAKETQENGAAAPEGQSLLTLTEVAKRTGISMPTLQKYKKRFGDRIPSEGKGRTQRYPESSLTIFGQLRDENMSKRGRPRKNAAEGNGTRAAAKSAAQAPTGKRRGRPPGKAKAKAKVAGKTAAKAASAAANGNGMLTLTQVARQTGISYPTLLRYVKTNLDKLPHAGKGRGRRFETGAVDIFQQLRAESGRPAAAGAKRGGAKAAAGKSGRRPGRPPGRPAKAAAAPAMSAGDSKLAAAVQKLEQRLARLEAQMKKPLRVEIKR